MTELEGCGRHVACPLPANVRLCGRTSDGAGEPAPPMMGLQAGDTVQVVGSVAPTAIRPAIPASAMPTTHSAKPETARRTPRRRERGGALTRWESAPWGFTRVLATARRSGTATLNENLPANEAQHRPRTACWATAAPSTAPSGMRSSAPVSSTSSRSPGSTSCCSPAFVWIALGAGRRPASPCGVGRSRLSSWPTPFSRASAPRLCACRRHGRARVRRNRAAPARPCPANSLALAWLADHREQSDRRLRPRLPALVPLGLRPDLGRRPLGRTDGASPHWSS